MDDEENLFSPDLAELAEQIISICGSVCLSTISLCEFIRDGDRGAALVAEMGGSINLAKLANVLIDYRELCRKLGFLDGEHPDWHKVNTLTEISARYFKIKREELRTLLNKEE